MVKLTPLLPQSSPESRIAQKQLAKEVTELVHGGKRDRTTRHGSIGCVSHFATCVYADAGLNRALAATEISFGRAKVGDYSAEEILDAFPSNLITQMPKVEAQHSSIVSLLVRSGVFGSKSESVELWCHTWARPLTSLRPVHSSSEADHCKRRSLRQ